MHCVKSNAEYKFTGYLYINKEYTWLWVTENLTTVAWRNKDFPCLLKKKSRVKQVLMLFLQLSDFSVDDIAEISSVFPKCALS